MIRFDQQYCIKIGEVSGLGSDEEEAVFDAQYNAAINFSANAIQLIEMKQFHQNKRQRNYAREPQLYARKGTRDYKYAHGFSNKALALALHCRSVDSQENIYCLAIKKPLN